MKALSDAGLLVFEFHEPVPHPKSEHIDPEFLKTIPVFAMIGAR